METGNIGWIASVPTGKATRANCIFHSIKITQEVRDFAAKQNSDSYLATENIKRETSPQEAEEAREGMSDMAELYKAKGERLYLPEGEAD